MTHSVGIWFLWRYGKVNCTLWASCKSISQSKGHEKFTEMKLLQYNEKISIWVSFYFHFHCNCPSVLFCAQLYLTQKVWSIRFIIDSIMEIRYMKLALLLYNYLWTALTVLQIGVVISNINFLLGYFFLTLATMKQLPSTQISQIIFIYQFYVT